MLQALDSTLSILGPALIVSSAGAWIYSMFFKPHNRLGGTRLYAVLLGVTFVGILLITGLSPIMVSQARTEAQAFLSPPNGPHRVFVRSEALDVAQSESLLAVLRSVRSMPAHNSHPDERIPVRVVSGGGVVMNLELGRDSESPLEYWVFQTGYHHTSMNEIGRVVTGYFSSE